MRLLLGMILGALLTVAAASGYDAMAARGDLGPGARQMVNWDVVGENWRDLRASLRELGSRVHEEWAKRSG